MLLPGHSIGLQGLAVDTDNGRAVLASDALWSARDATRGVPDVAFFNPQQAQAESRSSTRGLATSSIPVTTVRSVSSNGSVHYEAQYRYNLRFPFQP